MRPNAEVAFSLRRSPKTGLAVKDQVNVGSGKAKAGNKTNSYLPIFKTEIVRPRPEVAFR